MASRDFRYHLLSIGVNRDANGATIRSAERDAFGISWTFAQLGYWRAERNRCLTGGQATAPAIEAHLAHCAQIEDLDLLLVYWSGHVFSVDPVLDVVSQTSGARLRILVIDTCHADDRIRRLEASLGAMPDAARPVVLASCAADGRSRENSVHGFSPGPCCASSVGRDARARGGSICWMPSTAPPTSPWRASDRNRCSRPTARANCGFRSSLKRRCRLSEMLKAQG